jgi:hypothetical protein
VDKTEDLFIPESIRAEFDAAISRSAKRMADEIDTELVAEYLLGRIAPRETIAILRIVDPDGAVREVPIYKGGSFSYLPWN